MGRFSLIYGLICGALIAVSMLIGGLAAQGDGFMVPESVGYLIMLVAMSFIFIGVKKYRDQEQGGVIKFGTAFKLGLGIAVVASIIYVISWELYLAQTDFAFADQYIASAVEQKRATGASAADLAAYQAELAESMENYGNPLFRVPITFTEIFPVGLLVALVSAALLKNSKLLPARTA